MSKRNSKQQSKHDQKVKQISDSYNKKGWKVKADIPGYDQPDKIGKKNRIPDIMAKKGRAEHLIEVETKDTWKKIKNSIKLFLEVLLTNQEGLLKSKRQIKKMNIKNCA